jgi:hypothetical protein
MPLMPRLLRTADLTFFKNAIEITHFKRSYLLALFHGDHDALLRAVGGGRGDQRADQQAFDDLGGCHLLGLRVAFPVGTTVRHRRLLALEALPAGM